MMPSPTAEEVAQAVVAACVLTGERPADFLPGKALRARHVATAALRDAFPDVSGASMARIMGYKNANAMSVGLNTARNARWWDEMFVDEVVGVLVAPLYGQRAA